MKILSTTLLLAIIMVISSCKSQDQALKDFYRNTNNQMKSESFLIKSSQGIPAQQNEERLINNSAESAYMAQVKSKSEQYKVIHDESEYANGDVYLEAAKHRKDMIDKVNKGCPDCPKTTSIVATKVTNQPDAGANMQSTSGSKTPDFFAHLLNADKKLIRTEGVSYVDDKTNLKKYNVVIAALSKYEGTERLKKAFAGSGESLVIVRNDAGLYYVIIGSFDTEDQAMDKVKRIEMEYNSRYTAAQLQSKFGIAFTDLWLLRK